MANKVKFLLDRNDKLKTGRENFDRQFQVLGEYISQIKQAFDTQHTDGEFLNEDVFDSTGTFAAHNAASALLGMLWPATARKSVVIEAPEDMENITPEEEKWYSEVATRRLTRAMDDPDANLILSLDEYMLDQMIFGTSGVGTFWEEGKLFYRAYGVREMRIDEGKGGRINAVFLNLEWEVYRVVQEYGIKNVSEKVRKLFNAGKYNEKIKLLVVYQPRQEVLEGRGGNMAMPIESTHIEIETKNVLRESGFEEFPIHVGRFRKLTYEKYGRSPGMNALPDIREINALREAIIIATEKELDPPLGLLNSGMLGGGVVDTSAGALTVFDVQGNVGNSPPVFPINTVGDLNTALARIQDLQESIAQHFSLDRLLDFNNEVQMTATETQQRASIRNASLSSLIMRQVTELFTPLVERSFNTMLRNDQFGFVEGDPKLAVAQELGEDAIIIPGRIAERLLDGKDAYTVRFTTPADRIANAEELDGMINVVTLNQQLTATNPEAKHELNIAKIMENGVRLYGSPTDIINSPDDVKDAVEKEQKAIEQAQQLEAAKTASETVGNVQGAV